MPLDSATILAQARQCLAIEREALDATAAVLNEDFVAVVRAVETVVASGHKLIISGVGKNAHIAQKLAGTFNSTGVPSCFLDPTQALHGDLGLCAAGDLALLLSNGGASTEMLRLLPLFEKFGLTTVEPYFCEIALDQPVSLNDGLVRRLVPEAAGPVVSGFPVADR